jgi:hypothetical protein
MVDSIVQRAEGALVLVAVRELKPIGEPVPEASTQVSLLHAKRHVYPFVLAGRLNVFT